MKKIILLMLTVASLVSCIEDKFVEGSSSEHSTMRKSNSATTVLLQNHSATPVLLKKQSGFEKLQLFSIISSDDVLAESPSYIFGGSADGSGL